MPHENARQRALTHFTMTVCAQVLCLFFLTSAGIVEDWAAFSSGKGGKVVYGAWDNKIWVLDLKTGK